MGSEGQGRAEERGGGRGESYDILWLQPPVPGRRLATPARRGQERAQRGLARGAARTDLAGASQAGASRSLCFLRQQNTEAAGAGGTPQEPLPAPPKAIACSPPQACVPPRPLAISALPSLVLAGRAGAGGAFPAGPCSSVCGAVSCTATLPPGKGSWEMDVVVCWMGLRE